MCLTQYLQGRKRKQKELNFRLAYVSCVRQLEEVKAADYCDYIRPPIDKYGTLQFDSFDEIREVGYYHGQTYFAGLRKAGQLWFLQQVQNRRRSLENLDLTSQSTSSGAGGTSYARFTDLAEMVCRVRQVTPVKSESYGHLDLETDPEDSDIISDGDEELDEEESGFISNACPEDLGPSQRNLSRKDQQHH